MGPEWLIPLAIILVLFGGAQIPKLARSLGQAQKEFKTGLSEGSKPSEGEAGSKPSEGENDAPASGTGTSS